MCADTSTDDGPDPEAMQAEMRDLAARAGKVMQDFLEQRSRSDGFQVADPAIIARAFMEAGARMLTDPQQMIQAQMEWLHGYGQIWENALKRLSGEETDPVIQPAGDDRRFKDGAWSEEVLFDFIKQSYLLTSHVMRRAVDKVDGLDGKTREKVEFYTRQMINAMSPTNFAHTNPKVLREIRETGGENLVKGLRNLLNDMEEGGGELKIRMTDAKAFEIGGNIATTPGKVVFQNDLIQLIQYEPTTAKVYKRPLLVIPPWINKFYILDLREKNSLVKWIVDRGHTLFVISWANPDRSMAHLDFEDYMEKGPLAALDAIGKATGEKDANVIGYCIGGTLLACTLSHMRQAKDDRFKSATFFTAMMDFSEPGDLGVFVDEEQLENLERHMDEVGYLESKHMSQVFNMLRDNDLIWSFVVNNYLMGKDPFPFDLLYWNSDSTAMPAMMHKFYLRNCYLENRLVKPGGVSMKGAPIDLTKIDLPAYWISAKEDHIAPWRSTYKGTRLLSGPKRFVLSASGHIAGVVNPPDAGKYCYWTNDNLPHDPDEWFGGAERREGSWWPDWAEWVKRHAGTKVNARKPGAGELKAIEDAPGSYVKVRGS